ncbi:hypothetical protein [Parahaliea maris]|nr:hypothetical protein [Parahaliea maris]
MMKSHTGSGEQKPGSGAGINPSRLQIDFALPLIDANRVYRIRRLGTSLQHRWFWGITALLTITAIALALHLNNGKDYILRSLALSLFVPLFSWYGYVNKYRFIFGSASAIRLVGGRTVKFSYRITESGLTEIIDGSEGKIPFTDILDIQAERGETTLVTRQHRIVIPARSVERGELGAFLQQLNKRANPDAR